MVSSKASNQLSLAHIAFIMDGNRRWAEKHKLLAKEGHNAGFERFKEIVQLCFDKGIGYVTVYAFSTENWKRTEEEIGTLMSLMTHAIKNEIQNYRDKNIKVNIIGRKDDLPQPLQLEIEKIEQTTSEKDEFVLNVALSYGGKEEVVQSVRKAILAGKEISETTIEEGLYTAGQPNPDLIIRTGGQPRLSNFLMWQSFYSEIYFTDTLWPDFDANELDKAITFFSDIKRNFGK
jgi:undecaprenyl diphosphate synthase